MSDIVKDLRDYINNTSDIQLRGIAANEIESLRQQLSDTQREAAHWKNNHETEVRRARILKERTDMPIERVQAYERWCLDLAENAALRQQLASITEERDQWKNDAINGGNAAYLRQQLKDMTNRYNAALEAEQVRYRQVVEKDAEIARLYRDREQYGPDKVAIEKQAWVEADRQRQINELRKQLAEKGAEIERLKEEQAELIRRFQNENCGQTFMGEPVIQDRPVHAKQYMAAVNGRRAFRSQVIELRQQLAASQAREQQANECRIALVHQIHELADHIERAEYCINDIDMLKQMRGQRAYAMKVAGQWNQNGNPFSADTAALSALIAKAGEVMRERCAVRADWFTPFVGGKIRALRGVTLEDLK